MKTISRVACVAAIASIAGSALEVGATEPASDSGLDFYAQGGVVIEHTAYFASDDHCRRRGVTKPASFPAVVAFDLNNFQKRATYSIARMYDSAPMVLKNRTGRWLVIGHEHEKARTVAIDRDTGATARTSAQNEPGYYFFGYSHWRDEDDSSLILQASPNGLHALSSETGQDVWHLNARSTGGVTPCVDQKRGIIYYQSTGSVWKLRASDGAVLKRVTVPPPATCISWNTVLVNDQYGRFVATRWYGKPEWDSAIRVYDADLNLVWERTGLASGKKDTLVYAEGKLLTGVGNGWARNYTGDEWKKVHAYRIIDGTVEWTCDLAQHEFGCIPNILYFAGSFYAESQGSPPITSKLFRIRARDGHLAEMLDYSRPTTSCAPPVIAHGKLFSGDLWRDAIVVTELATGSKSDWPSPFGHPQHNDCANADSAHDIRLVPMREIGQ